MPKEFAEFLHLPYQPTTLQQSLAWNLEQVDGVGFLVGDVADLQKWDNALLPGRVLTGKAKALFYTEGHLNNGKPAYTGPENPAHKPGVYLYGGLGQFSVENVEVYGANGGTSGLSHIHVHDTIQAHGGDDPHKPRIGFGQRFTDDADPARAAPLESASRDALLEEISSSCRLAMELRTYTSYTRIPIPSLSVIWSGASSIAARKESDVI